MSLLFVSGTFVKKLKDTITSSDKLSRNIKREFLYSITKMNLESPESTSFSVLADSIVLLGSAGYYLGDESYFKQVERLINLIITRSMAFSDTVRNKEPEQVSSEMQDICKSIHGLSFLSLYPKYSDICDKFNSWLDQYMSSFDPSSIVLLASSESLVSSIWINALLMSYGKYTNKDSYYFFAIDYYKNSILPALVTDDSEVIDSLTLIQIIDCLDGAAFICELAYVHTIDLWTFTANNGVNLKRSIEYVLPYVRNPYLWQHPVPNGEVPQDCYAFQLASLRLDMEEALEINQIRSASRYLIRNQNPLGPLSLLPGSQINPEMNLYAKIGYNIRGYSHSK